MTEGRRKKEGLAHLLTHSATECCVGSADGRRPDGVRSVNVNNVVGRQSPNTTNGDARSKLRTQALAIQPTNSGEANEVSSHRISGGKTRLVLHAWILTNSVVVWMHAPCVDACLRTQAVVGVSRSLSVAHKRV